MKTITIEEAISKTKKKNATLVIDFPLRAIIQYPEGGGEEIQIEGMPFDSCDDFAYLLAKVLDIKIYLT